MTHSIRKYRPEVFRKGWPVLLMLKLVAGAAAVLAEDLPPGKALVENQCQSCHNFAASSASDFSALVEQKAPDLYYAGNKFKVDWLRNWLQNPLPIRYSGDFFLNSVLTRYRGDRIASGAVKEHPVLNAEEADSVTDYLMSLTIQPPEKSVFDRTGKYSNAKTSYLFRKKQACVGCHRIRQGRKTIGGISGPDLTTAGNRLNPDWLLSYIAKPGYWNRLSIMPDTMASPADIQALGYFLSRQTRQGDRTNTAAVNAPVNRNDPQRNRSLGPADMHNHQADKNYRRYCVQCHGTKGNGSGLNDTAGGMSVSPKSHKFKQWMRKLSDAEIADGISGGGPAVGKSSLMPAWKGTLDTSEIEDLVDYIRRLCKCQGPG